MGFSSSTLLIIALLSITFTAESFAQRSLKNLIPNVTLAGTVTCENADLSTVETFKVIRNAKVDVVCGILQRLRESTLTNLRGVYSFSFTPSEALFNVPETCRVKVTVPSDTCVFETPGGYLSYPVISVRSRLGIVMAYVPGAPTYVQA